MENFSYVFGPVLAVALGIIVLSVFFKILSRFGKTKDEPALIKLKGFFKNAEFVDVHLGGANVLKKVRVIGVSDVSQIGKGGFPYELNGMVVLEKENKKRIMIKAKLITMIVESETESDQARFSEPGG
jgi:hypothetical protein